GHANRSHERAGFCADLAAEAETKTALDTGAAAGPRLGKNRHGGRERMPAQLSGGAFKEHSRRFNRQRRHGIRLRARRIERTCAGQAGNANLPFHLRSEEHTSELQSRGQLVCRLLLEKQNPAAVSTPRWPTVSPTVAFPPGL